MLASAIIVGQYKPSVYAHLRGLLSHGRSPFRSCPRSSTYLLRIHIWYNASLNSLVSYRGLTPHKLVGMPGIPKNCTTARDGALLDG